MPHAPSKSRRNAAILKAFAAGATYAELGRRYGLTDNRIRDIVAKEMRIRRIFLDGYSRKHRAPARLRALINGLPVPPLPEPKPPRPAPAILFEFPPLTLREVLEMTRPPEPA